MTQEHKQLLLKDLSARLPYGVKMWFPSVIAPIVLDEFVLSVARRRDEEFKPYLRLMDSMTEEEKLQLKEEQLKDTRLFAEALTKAAEGDTSMRGKVIPHFAADWCNKNHFDFHGLIEKGLALEASDDMYKFG